MMTSAYVNLNGAVLRAGEARVSLLDHGLLYGDGVFETLRVCEGRIFRPEAHLARLAESCRRLDLPLPAAPEALRDALESVVAANAIRDGALRLTVTRGEGPPLPDPTLCETPAYFVTSRAWEPGAATARPVWRALVAGTHPRTFIPGIKCLSYLPFQQARMEARRRGCDEAILTHGGDAIEASTSNVFVVSEGKLRTPDLQSGCLPGMARELLLELAPEAGLEPQEAALPVGELRSAGEVLLSNSVMGPVPVVRLDDRAVGDGRPGPATVRLSELYAAHMRRVCMG